MFLYYEPVDALFWPVVIVVILSFITGLGTYLAIVVGRRWKKRQNRAAKLLFLTLVLTILVCGCLMVALLHMVVVGEKREVYMVGLGAGLTSLAFLNVVLLLFVGEIFSIPVRDLAKYIVVNVVIGITMALPNNYYGYDVDRNPLTWGPNIRTYTSFALMIFSLITYSRIFAKAWHARDRVDHPVAKMGFTYIAASQVALILLFVFYLLDTLSWVFFPEQFAGGYSFFTAIAYSFGGVFMVLAYLGYYMPDWLKRRIEQKRGTLAWPDAEPEA